MPVRVLIVEDDDLEVHFLARMLGEARTSFEVRSCASAEEAMVEVFDRRAIDELDWVVIDLRLPCADGFTLMDEMNRFPTARKPRMVVFSTSDHHRDLAAARRCGAAAYFVKGFGDESARKMIDYMVDAETSATH